MDREILESFQGQIVRVILDVGYGKFWNYTGVIMKIEEKSFLFKDRYVGLMALDMDKVLRVEVTNGYNQ